ncbi:MAG: hypothetical protein JWS10_2182 [Cypionkella sp.]|uniref:gene transfer agent family protein n=1 Tax=Cypionkella sp. TaxID=2811411 RepID=UPI00261D0A79|nr:gene transfer agent family protein [Cypionkella sp.]MDB5659567.1 hypothetical protein [Cypionkella sp.]
MPDKISHRGFFGTTDYTFCLTDEMLAELEHMTARGIGAIYADFIAGQFTAEMLREIIRLGMIGGGAGPDYALRKVNAYATNRPLGELVALALSILDARWSGVPEVAA